jgi:iron complex transport system ATP-binding protein
MAGEVLQLAGVRVVRGTSTLLDEVDWTVRPDEKWAVLGPNGAGKTTLLSVAAARLFPTAGTVDLLDERLGRVDVFELRPRIGLASAALADSVPAQESVLDVVLTAGYAIFGRSRERYDAGDEARARQLLGQMGCRSLLDRPFGVLSEGERKRVLIARALMTDPELLLLDEPAAGLDLGGREDLVRRLGRLARDPIAPSMIMVTHHVEEIAPGFTHVLMIRQGKVLAAGPLELELTSRNLSRCFGLPLVVEQLGERWTAQGLPLS